MSLLLQESPGGPPEPGRHSRAGEAYLVLTLCMAFWAGNSIAGRLAVEAVSPMALNLLRWSVVVLVLAAFPRHYAEARRVFMIAPVRVVLMGAGLAIFNSAFYVAARHTTALNISIIQGSIPALLLVGAFVFHRAPMFALQVVGTGMTLLGVMFVASGGDVTTFLKFEVNRGDLLIAATCVCYAAYALGIRGRPEGTSMGFFCALAVVALISGIPLLAFEALLGNLVWPNLMGWVIVAFVGLFPSMLSQIYFIRGVATIGAGRAGLFLNLVPVFGSALAVMFLGETVGLHHLAGLLLVLSGIAVAESQRAKLI